MLALAQVRWRRAPDAPTPGTLASALRTVLLKGLDARGFVFFTNLESRKARHIAENSHVSLLFPWLPLERQVVVTGTAAKLPATESLKYFLARPRDSQLAAWASPQSSVISSRKVLEMEWAHLKAKFAEGKVPLPSFWGGFRVKPVTIEFWQGGPNRLHDRFQYVRQADELMGDRAARAVAYTAIAFQPCRENFGASEPDAGTSGGPFWPIDGEPRGQASRIRGAL